MENVADLSEIRRAREISGLSAHEAQRLNLARLRRVEQQIAESRERGEKGPVFGGNDRLCAAKVAGEMLVQAKEYRSASDLMTEFGRRLDRCCCNPDDNLADPSVRKRLLERPLVHKVEPYLKLAEILAKARNVEPDQAKIAILEKTSIWNLRRQLSPKPFEVSESAEFLTLELNELASRVYRDCNIADLEERLQRIPANFDRLRNAFVPGVGGLIRHSWARYYEAFEESEAKFPSTPVCRLFHSEIRVRAFLHSEIFSDPHLVSGLMVPHPWPQPGADALGEEIDIRLVTKREIRLAFGWGDSLERFQPLFETRGHVSAYLSPQEGLPPNELFPHLTLAPLQRNLAMLILHDGGWRKLSLLCDGEELSDPDRNGTLLRKSGLSPNDWSIDPLDRDGYAPGDWAVSWLPVTPEYVQCLLGEARHNRDDLDIDDVGSLEGLSLEPNHEAFWFSAGTIGFTVEHKIKTGALRKSLVAAVTQFSDALDAHELNWRRAAEAKTSAVIDDLRSDLRPALFERPQQ